MPPGDDAGGSRTSSPSLTERVRSLASVRTRPSWSSKQESRSGSAAAGYEDGPSSHGESALEELEMDAEKENEKVSDEQLRESAIQIINGCKTIDDLTDAATDFAQEAESYSVETLTIIWQSTIKLVQEDAPIEARRAAFSLLEASVSVEGLGPDIRLRFAEMIMVPVDASEVDSQVKCLRALTRGGKDLHPFADQYTKYLVDTIESQYAALTNARRNAKSQESRPQADPQKGYTIPQERGFQHLLSLVTDTVGSNPGAFDDDSIAQLLSRILVITEKTTSKNDMRKAVGILRTTIIESTIPTSLLTPCFQILCAIGNAVQDLSALTYESLILLLKASGADAVEVLLETIALPPQDRHSHTVCGALALLSDIAVLDGKNNLPTITYQEYITALGGVHFASRRIRISCLRSIANVFGASHLTDRILEYDWSETVVVILQATGDSAYIQEKLLSPHSLRQLSYPGSRSTRNSENVPSAADRKLTDEVILELKRIADSFNRFWPRLGTSQRDKVGKFYRNLSSILPAECLKTLIETMGAGGSYRPGQPGWLTNQEQMLSHLLSNRELDTSTCNRILELLIDTVKDAQKLEDIHHYCGTVRQLLEDFHNHKNVSVANEMATFAVATWKKADSVSNATDLTTYSSVLLEMVSTTSSSDSVPGIPTSREPPKLQRPSNEVSTSLISLFLHFLQKKSSEATIMFNILIKIAKSEELAASVRLPVLKLMMRLRCDHSNAILVVAVADALGLAATLRRTETFNNQKADKASVQEDAIAHRTNRASTISHATQNTMRGNSRFSLGNERAPSKSSIAIPLWMYPGGAPLPDPTPQYPSQHVYQHTRGADENTTLKLSEWLIVIIDILQRGGDWEVYSYVLVHLPSQLVNPTLFANAGPHIKMLRSVITSQLQSGKFQEPPADSGVKKGDIALCLMHSQVMLLGYSDHFARTEQEEIVRTFLAGIANWDRTAKFCIQALTLCCHVVPGSITKLLSGILQKMAQIITQAHLTMDVLEFLGGLARLPDIYVNFREDEFRIVFGICVRYLEHSRDQRLKLGGTDHPSNSANRLSGLSARSGSLAEGAEAHKDLPQYVFALAHHVITVWFLSLKLSNRSDHVGYISKNLAWTDQNQNEIMEEQSQVTLDMMHRTAYLDLGETQPEARFTEKDGKVLKKTWLVGMSIVTLETASGSGLTQIIKRQASGTTYASYCQQTAQLPPHHVPMQPDVLSSLQGPDARINIFPNHVFLQLQSTIAPTPTPMEPICLPDDDTVARALAAFDRNDTVDGYKVGVIYVGNGQTQEIEILANTAGSPAFNKFLEGIGTKVALKGANFNTQGLDRVSDSDGTHTYAWRDRVAEIVFHIPTMMPTDTSTDALCVNKKRHIGNDFVNVIFNESGLPFKFDTFPSQFNYVNIVITPDTCVAPRKNSSFLAYTSVPNTAAQIVDEETGEIRDRQPCFTIQTVSHPTFPSISPAASCKLIPLSRLGPLVRQLALNSSVFSNVWANREGGEHVSSWRNRLREINRLRERYSNTGTSTSTKYPGAKGIKTYVPGDIFKGKVEMGGLAEEEEGVLAGLDFSRWAGPNPPLN